MPGDVTAGPPQPGDVVLFAGTGSSWLSRAIRWAQGGVPVTHAALVTHATPLVLILDVAWTIAVRSLAELGARDYQIVRPCVDGEPASEALGRRVADDSLQMLRRLEDRRYPWWRLPAYLFPRDWRDELVGQGPRQVCSVWTVRAWAAHGLAFWAWDGDRRRRLAHDEIVSVDPRDLWRLANEEGWPLVSRTPGFPA